MFYNIEREKRIQVFNDTLSKCNENKILRTSIEDSIKSQVIYLENDKVLDTQNNNSYDTKIIVSTKRTFEAASAYKGKKVCVLNFASATNPGGGVKRGSSAQEECLCRCSTLFPCINEKSIFEKFHLAHRNALHSHKMSALYNNDCVFTPNIVVFKSDTSNPIMLDEKDWYKVDVITCAAPNLRENPSNAMNPDGGTQSVHISDYDLEQLHYKRAKHILNIAKAHNEEVVILGAFGCGAFQNPPEVVAKGISKAILEFKKDFEVIEFAIYSSSGKENYNAFKKELLK